MRRNFLLLLLLSCIEPYDFEVAKPIKVLVVDGSLTNVPGLQYVKLSYSYALDQDSASVSSGAQVCITDDLGNTIEYLETRAGYYEPDEDSHGTTGRKYQLSIRTADGEEYLSSMDELLPTGELTIYGRYEEFASENSAGFDAGVQFYVDVNGTDENKIHNYRIQYGEDFQVNANYPKVATWNPEDSTLKWVSKDSIVYYQRCYRNRPSQNSLEIATTSGQINSDLKEFPLRQVDPTRPELLIKYSTTVTTFRISSEAYQYYKDLKENNESAGSFFDRQKGTFVGNIQNIDNPENLVLGYFEVAGVVRKFEIFEGNQWGEEGYKPTGWAFTKDCFLHIDTLAGNFSDLRNAILAEEIDMVNNNVWYATGLPPLILWAPLRCTDCTTFASPEKPDFWPD